VKSDPLQPRNVSDARSLIHDSLEYLYCRGAKSLVELDFKAAFGATDTLLDTEEALCAFENDEWPSGIGMSYLLTIGTLQVLIIQQDATRVLCRVFGLTFKPDRYPELRRIRDIRVRVAGHPSRHGEWKKDAGSTFFVRQLFTKRSAKVVTYFDEPSRIESNDIDLTALFTTQQDLLRRSLSLIWAKILHDYPEAAYSALGSTLVSEYYPFPAGIKIEIGG
jgi:hypothetical protein